VHALDRGSLLLIATVVGGVLLAFMLFGSWLGSLNQPEQDDPELKAALDLPPEQREPLLVRWLLYIGPRRRPPPPPPPPPRPPES
jgi:hypothetical protein